MVRAVNKRDVCIGRLELFAESQSAEAGTHHHDMELFIRHG